MTVAVCPVRPDSRGTIMARSADPFAAPVITPNYLSDPNDQRVLNAGMRITRQIFAAPAIAQHSVEEILPGPAVVSDEELADYARRFGTTIFHPVGTCRMGEGPGAVVDSRLRVHGIGGLRVIDASVMPTLTTGNTNAPTIMIAEKGAAMIREDRGLRLTWPAALLISAVPEQPLILRGADERRHHARLNRRRRRFGRPIGDADHGADRFAERLRPHRCRSRRDTDCRRTRACAIRAADVPVDPEARQQRRDQHLPRIMVSGGQQETRVAEAIGRRLGIRKPRGIDAELASDSVRAAPARRPPPPARMSRTRAALRASGPLRPAIARTREYCPRYSASCTM